MKAIPAQSSGFETSVDSGIKPEPSGKGVSLNASSPSPSPPPSQREAPSTPPPRRKARNSFADYNALSSPITTPVASPLPQSPALNSLVAEALNSAAVLNASRPPRSTGSSAVALPRKRHSNAPLSLPRRVMKSSDKSLLRPNVHAARSHSMSSESTSSTRDVETQLTQNAEASPPNSQSPSQPQSQPESQFASYPADPYPPIQTQAPYDSPSKSSQTLSSVHLAT